MLAWNVIWYFVCHEDIIIVRFVFRKELRYILISLNYLKMYLVNGVEWRRHILLVLGNFMTSVPGL